MKSPRNSDSSKPEDDNQEDEPEEEIDLSTNENRVKWIQSLVDTEGMYESPINVNLSHTIPMELPLLNWHHYELQPKKMKLTNTGHTLILSAKWHQERPFLSNGPLLGNYVFSQLHFHWGSNDMEGSEHTIDGGQHPLEMHVVHFKSCYLTQEAALKEKDGIIVLAFFFKLQAALNPAIQVLVDALPIIQKPHNSARLDPLPLNFLVREFTADYYLYWGAVTTTACIHLIMWLLSREPIGITAEQLENFRSLMDTNEEPLIRNFRNVQPLHNRRLFHICPSPSKYSTLLPIPKDPYKYTFNTSSKNPRPLKSASQQSQQVFRVDTKTHSPFKPRKQHRKENEGPCISRPSSRMSGQGEEKRKSMK